MRCAGRVCAWLDHFDLCYHARTDPSDGLWEGIVTLPRPPPPPFDIETMEPIEPPWQAIKEWIPDDEPDLDWFNRPRNPNEPDPDWFDQTPT